MLPSKPILFISFLLATLFTTLNAQEEDNGDVCLYLPCPAIALLKEVNGVEVTFGPCCMKCSSCGSQVEPVCLSSGDSFMTYDNACLACTANGGGFIANGACPGGDTGEAEGEFNEEGEFGNEEGGLNEEGGFNEENDIVGVILNFDNLFASND